MQGKSIQRLETCFRQLRRLGRSQCRYYSTKVLKGNDLGPIQHNENQSFRIFKDGKTLPLPPVLDPVVISKQSRWKQKKERPNVENFTPFQKKLWQNPYAHALASPVRECRASFAILPSSYLLTLQPRPHPTTEQPWLLPVSLTTTKHHLGPPYRFLAHIHVASYLTKKRAWEKGLYTRLTQKLGRKACQEIVWREDMPDFLLRLLQKKVVEKLAWWFKGGRLVPCTSPRSEDIDTLDDVSCVLYLGSLHTRADELQKDAAATIHDIDKWVRYYMRGFPKQLDPHKKAGVTHASPLWYVEPVVPRLQPRTRFPPLEFKTTVWRGRKVALYSLPDMLGEEKARELILGSKFKDERCLTLKSGRHNVPIEMLLMQLQSYMAQCGP